MINLVTGQDAKRVIIFNFLHISHKVCHVDQFLRSVTSGNYDFRVRGTLAESV